MNPNYSNSNPEQSSMAGEPAVAMMLPKASRPFAGKRTGVPHVGSWQEKVKAFVYANYDEARAKELEAQNFLIGQPFVYDEAQTEQDWEQIEQAAAESGEATPQAIKKVFDRWLNL